MKLVVGMLMKYLSSIIQNSDIDHQEMQNKEVMVGWNAEMVEPKRLEDLQPTHYTSHTRI